MLALRDSPGTANEYLALVKFWLTLGGIYIWEFISTISYEWNVMRGRHPYRWTIWIYSTARLATLMTVILNMTTFFCTSPINCQVLATFTWAFASLGLGSGSLLIMLRICAIWDRNKVIMAISAGLWGLTASLLLLGIVRIRSVWEPVANTCIITNVETSKPSLVSLFATDLTLLLIMLAGLLRLRNHGGGTLEIGRLLWKQGVIWFAIATIAELPQALFLILSLNDVFDMMFMLPALVTMTIAATRMYRSLRHFGSPPNIAQNSENLRSSQLLSNTKPSVVHIPSNQLELEVTVHTAREECSTSQTNHCASYSSSDAQPTDNLKLHELVIDDDIEGCKGK